MGAVVIQRRGGAGQLWLVDIDQRHLAALGQEQFRRRQPDAAGRARHDRRLLHPVLPRIPARSGGSGRSAQVPCADAGMRGAGDGPSIGAGKETP